MSSNKIKKWISTIIVNAVLILMSLTCIFPVVWMIYSSLKSRAEFGASVISLPKVPLFSNYKDAFRVSHMGLYMLNTIFNTVISVFFIILFSFIIAYFLSRFKFRGRNAIYALILIGLLVPIYALLVPIFIQFKSFGIFDQRFTLIIPYVAFGLPFSVFLIESYLKGIPTYMEEAAVIDGSGFIRMLFNIVMPLVKPMLITVGILQFFRMWNEFPLALVLVNNEAYKTIPLGLVNFNSQYSVNYPLKMAALTMSILPAMLLYIIFNRKIIEGMVAGAIKG